MSNKYKISGLDYFAKGEFYHAIEDLEIYCKNQPESEAVYSALADSYMELDNKPYAATCYSKALELNPTNTENLLKLSALQLSGSDYIETLKIAHQRLKPKRYIEIGVCKGVSFNLARKSSVAVGVDPEPQIDIDGVAKNHKIMTSTSDDYFASEQIRKDFDGKPFDMAFLDGMHLFEFVLRDFLNLERYSHSNSIVFVHDLYPMNAETATRERNSDFWSGDVWKLVLCLKEYRPDLKIEVLPCPPTGLGVITKLDNMSPVLENNYDEIVQKYIHLPYEIIQKNKDKKLSLAGTDSDWLEQYL